MLKKRPLFIYFFIPLVLGCSLSLLVAWEVDRINQQKIEVAVTDELVQTANEISARLNRYRYGLQGTRGAVIMLGEKDITRALFHRYSLGLDITGKWPGVGGFGFIRRVPQGQENEFLLRARLDDKPDFRIHELFPHQGDHYIVQYIEPAENNRDAIGFDVASDMNQQEAAEKSVVVGSSILTAPIRQSPLRGDVHYSFFIFLPIYHSEKIPATPAQRKEDVYGWSYAPLLLNEALTDIPANPWATHLTLRDVTTTRPGEVFFSSPQKSAIIITTQMIEQDLLGRRWQFELSVYPLFIKNLNLLNSTYIYLIGFIFSFLSAALTGVSGINRERKGAIFIEKARIASIVESSLDGIIGQDLDGTVISWNPAAETIFGYTVQEALGNKLTDLVVPANLQHEEKNILSQISKGEIVSYFTTIRHRKDGSELPVSVAVAPLRDTDGNIIGASKTLRDITVQKAAENRILELNLNLENQVAQRTEQLETARRNLETVLDAVPSMIGYWDKHLINRVANRAYHDWFGLEHKTIPGMHASELLGEELFALNRHLMEAALRGEKQTFNRTIPTPAGIRHSLAHYLPDINNGEVQGFYVIVHDITNITEANKRLENALLENKALLTTINQQMLYSVTDVEGNITEVNSNFCAASGYTREELIGKRHRILNSAVHPQEFWREMWEKITSGKAWHGEVCNRAKNGELYWLDTVVAPFRDANEKTLQYISLRSNITERKRAESERNQLSLLINNVLGAASEVSIIATDANGLITIFNRGAELMLGYNEQDIIGKCNPQLFHAPEEVANRSIELSEQYGCAIEGFRVFVHESELLGSDRRNWTYVRKDQSRLQVFVVVTTMRDAVGNIIGYLGIGTDVTEDLKNKRALKSTIDQFSIATDVAELGVWSWTFADDSLDFNDRMYEIYSLPLELRTTGLKFHDWLARIHPEEVESLQSSLRDFIKHGGIYDAVFRIVNPDSRIRFIQVRAQIEKDERGNSIKATGVNRDITSQRELETWLRQAKENADAANAAKSTFLANISHEIRTPMNGILGMLQLIQQTELSTRQRNYLSKTHTAAKSLLGLLNDILDFSKIDSGKLKLDMHPFELEPMLRDLAVILYGTQGQKEVEVIFDLDPLLPKTIIGDRLRLQQILINLAGNALKFTRQGYVLIGFKLLEINSQSLRTRISVSDSGIGISREKITHIFEEFVQAEASITRRFGGTGLGLSISKRLVNLMGGDLLVESAPGLGSRFWFDINFTSTGKEPITIYETRHIFEKLRILVVDDSALIREIVARTISVLGGQVDNADGGHQAIEKIRIANDNNLPYDIVLIDRRMPDLDGFTAAKIMCNIPMPEKKPAIFILTAYGHDEDLADLHEQVASPIRFLNKPITPQQLINALLQATAGPSGDALQFPAPELPRQPLAGLHLLVVEDNALNRQVASELLNAEGARVELATGGLDGVIKVLESNEAFDLVIMDVQMPDMDGLEATRRIRAQQEFQTLPILAMTANVSATDREACLKAGMNAHIGKPIDMVEVVPTILALLGKPAIYDVPALPRYADTAATLVDDFQLILARFGGKVDLYNQLFENFYAGIASALENLEGQQQDAAAAAATLHSIRNIAGTMGAGALGEVAKKLETNLKSQTTAAAVITTAAIDELRDLLDKSHLALKSLLEEFKATAPGAMHQQNIVLLQPELQKELGEILTLLESDNMSAIDRLEALYPKTQRDQQLLVSEALAQASSLQYSLAIATLTRLLTPT